MKKINYLIGVSFLFFSFWGCSQMDFEEELELKSSRIIEDSNPNYDVGIESAKTFVTIINNSDENKDLSFEIEPIVYADDTLLYIVNYADNGGWLIVSGDKRTESVLATSDEGAFKVDGSNHGVLVWLDALCEDVLALKQSDYVDTTSVDFELWNNIEELNSPLKRAILEDQDGYWELSHIESKKLDPITKGPYIQTKWGQGKPWNEVVPYVQDYSKRCLVGCVAVAGAQMVYYLNSKIGMPEMMYSKGICYGWSKNEDGWLGKGSSYGFSFSNPTSNVWDRMAMKYFHTGTEESAILMGFVGSQIGMNYGGDASGAQTGDLVGLYSSLGIKSSFQGYNSSTVLSSLNSEMPVIVSAYRTKKRFKFIITWKTWYEDGHAWIIDGYERQRTQFTYHYTWVTADDGDYLQPMKSSTLKPPFPRNETKTTTSTTSVTLLTMNWGWDGGSVDNAKYSLSGDWSPSSNRNYQYERKMISGFGKK